MPPKIMMNGIIRFTAANGVLPIKLDTNCQVNFRINGLNNKNPSIIYGMKKFVLFIGLVLLFSGMRLYDNGLLSVSADGKYTVYGKNGAETVYEKKPILDRFDAYTRLDIAGGRAEAEKGLKELNAKILWEERIGNITILYAYAPTINRSETVKDRRVNVMVAVTDAGVAFGSPLLKGSY